jgi:hypothetical protein
MIQNPFESRVTSEQRTGIKSFVSYSLIALFSFLLSACFQPSIPISTNPKYPIDVFFGNQNPDRPYEVIQKLETRKEVPLNPEQSRGGRMLYRGNDGEQKELLTAQMVVDAKKLGADALVQVKYRYYTTQTANGYSLEGVAVRYRGD